MKIKLLILGACLGASLFSGCNDELSSIGTSIQPSDDTIAVYTDTFRIKTTTVLLDSIYAKTTAAQLGELYDPVYGNLKSDFMCQFYCPSGFKFEHTPIDGKIDSVLYRIYYIDMTGSSYNGAWAGDSLAPMRAEISPNFCSTTSPGWLAEQSACFYPHKRQSSEPLLHGYQSERTDIQYSCSSMISTSTVGFSTPSIVPMSS